MTATITDARRWYCLRTATRREKDTVAALVEHFAEAVRSSESVMGAEVYLPLEKRKSPLKRVKEGTRPEDAFETVERPLLVGYLFVKCLPGEAEECVPDHKEKRIGVTGVHGVLKYYRDDGRLVPFPMSTWAVEGLMAQQAAGDFDYTPVAKRYRPGKDERVRITHGHFLGALGDVISMSADERRVTIETTIFGRTGPMELSIEHIEPAPPLAEGVAA